MAMTKSEALAIVFSSAEAYKENLMNRTLLFVCTDKHKNIFDMEVTFDKNNFKHLTGLKTNIDASHFFNLCISRRLSEKDFEFAEDGTTPLKMNVLPRLVKKNLSANMIGDYNVNNPKQITEKLAGNVTACIGFIKTGKLGRYVPNTILEGDIRNRVAKVDRIILTYEPPPSCAQVCAMKVVSLAVVTVSSLEPFGCPYPHGQSTWPISVLPEYF